MRCNSSHLYRESVPRLQADHGGPCRIEESLKPVKSSKTNNILAHALVQLLYQTAVPIEAASDNVRSKSNLSIPWYDSETMTNVETVTVCWYHNKPSYLIGSDICHSKSNHRHSLLPMRPRAASNSNKASAGHC